MMAEKLPDQSDSENRSSADGDAPIGEQVPETPFILVALSYPFILFLAIVALAVCAWLIW
jgi:hypothetical protein